jgi:CBS domain-containing protein
MNLDAPISSIMTSSVECVSPDQKIIDIKHIYEKPTFHSHIPVTENDKIVGIVSLVNFMRAIHDATLDDNELVYNTITVRDIMTPHVSSVSPDTVIREVVSVLAKGNFHSMVIATDNEVKGIVTTADILKELLED